ncbi:MAG: hypothetical protein Q8O00_12085 [Holophaga sp.]|nr:hypothetical protein [Holophaga sp.]
MKKLITDTMLMPSYVSRFSCIGGDGEDTCCAGWTISVSSRLYLHSPELAQNANRALVAMGLDSLKMLNSLV